MKGIKSFKEIFWKIRTEAFLYFGKEYDFVHKRVILFSDYPYRKKIICFFPIGLKMSFFTICGNTYTALLIYTGMFCFTCEKYTYLLNTGLLVKR